MPFGAAAAAVCAQGAAAAGGARTTGATSPIAVTDATDSSASRGNTDTSNLRWVPVVPDAKGFESVTIVSTVGIGVSDTPYWYPPVTVSRPPPPASRHPLKKAVAAQPNPAW